MPRDLFGNVTRPSISIGNRKWYTVPLSLLSHAIVVGALVVVPLMATEVLPTPWQSMEIDYIPAAPTPPPPPPPPPIRRELPASPPTDIAVPVDAPDGISAERPRPHAGFESDMPGPDIVIGDPGGALAPPPPPPAKEQEALRIGGQIRAPQKTNDVRPVYPPLALAARVQGIVIIEATIGVGGRVVDARILRSIPLLDQAALDAVRQWEYMPTTLNGVPVPVIMSVTVTFQLRP
jgi:protein TonB